MTATDQKWDLTQLGPLEVPTLQDAGLRDYTDIDRRLGA